MINNFLLCPPTWTYCVCCCWCCSALCKIINCPSAVWRICPCGNDVDVEFDVGDELVLRIILIEKKQNLLINVKSCIDFID